VKGQYCTVPGIYCNTDMPGRSWNGTRGKVSGCSLGASDELTNNRKPPEMSGLLFILKLGHNQDHKNPLWCILFSAG